jgi:type VI secretion system protein ImpF
MAQLDLPQGLLPTLKDRLLDPDSMGTRDMPGYSMDQILESVREDLEELLNTRRPRDFPETQYPELARSVAAYGLTDLSSIDTSTPAKRESIGRILEKTIMQHEPRLHNVRAAMDAPSGLSLSATYQVHAELRVDPAPPVAFQTIVELTTGHVEIRDGAP